MLFHSLVACAFCIIGYSLAASCNDESFSFDATSESVTKKKIKTVFP